MTHFCDLWEWKFLLEFLLIVLEEVFFQRVVAQFKIYSQKKFENLSRKIKLRGFFPTPNTVSWTQSFLPKNRFFQSQNFYKETGCKSSATRKNDFFRKKVRVRLYFAYWFRTRLHTSIFRSRFPNYFLGINFGLSHTSYKRINTVDLSLAHINYGLKIFMRETKFVLIHIFSILRSFNGYSCHHVKIPVKPTNCRHTV